MMYAMNTSSNKELLAVCRNAVPNCRLSSTNSKGSSTINTGIMGNVVRKIVSVILPTEVQIRNVSKNRQSLSAPDIFVDIDLTPGITKLRIPKEKESNISDQSKSLSNGNSPSDWYQIAAALENESYLKESDTYRKRQPRKRTKKSLDGRCSMMSYPETYLNTQQKSFVPGNICRNSKSGDKNRKQKNRRSCLVEIMEDIRSISDDSESDLEVVNFLSTQNDVQEGMEKAKKSLLEMNSLPFCDKAIWQPIDQQTVLECENIDEDDDDSFVIFSEDMQQITPATSSSRKNDVCAEINNFFVPGGRAQRRQHQISECSDDSIVFCDSDAASIAYQQDSDSDDSDICDEDLASQSLQLDSGFEEKKVRFNPVPEVHVMRMWNFAYRQARKGCWEMAARDRERFKKRIEETERVLAIVFEQTRREHIFRERFNS